MKFIHLATLGIDTGNTKYQRRRFEPDTYITLQVVPNRSSGTFEARGNVTGSVQSLCCISNCSFTMS